MPVASELDKQFQIRWRSRLAGGLVLACACACAPVALPDGERRTVLRETCENVVLPTHVELSERTAQLRDALSLLDVASPEADLQEARDAFRAARAPWKEAEAFGFGPSVTLHSVAAIDQAPADLVTIDEELAGGAELTLDYVEQLGANKRGLHAIEYLLFPADDAGVDEALTLDDESGERRRQFLRVASEIVAAHAAELEAAWQPDGGGYFTRFTQPGAEDSVTDTVQQALDTLLNEGVFLSEQIANAKLGKPLGLDRGGESDPSLQESELSGLSLADMLANLRGIRNVYLGSRDSEPGLGLWQLVREKSAATDARARAALDNAEAALLAVPEPFTQAILEEPETVSAAYDAMKELKRVLATEVVGVLGASLKFNDNDGD